MQVTYVYLLDQDIVLWACVSELRMNMVFLYVYNLELTLVPNLKLNL